MALTLEQMRHVQWGRTYLWEIQFLGNTPPSPFNAWFPATDVRENLYTLQTQGFSMAASTFDVPSGSTNSDLNITFYDDEKHTLANWFTEWVQEVLGIKNNRRLQTIAEASRLIMIKKLNSYQQMIAQNTYLVYPKDSLYFEGNSQADIHKYSIPLVVTGTI